MKSRIDKLLASNGFGSRRDIKRMLKSRAFLVNGAAVVDPGTVVDSETDSFSWEGKAFKPREKAYLMLNKPSGVVTSTSDPGHDTVMDLLAEPWSLMDLHPVGRLDIDTEGLLLLTNDGPLTHRLTSPKTGVDKTYEARLRDPVGQSAFEEYRAAFGRGVTFHDGYTTLPAKLDLPSNGDADGPNAVQSGAFPRDAVLLTVQEGKYHQVKKMFKTVGNEVIALRRISMGPVRLDRALPPGGYRELSESEIRALRLAVGNDAPVDGESAP